MGDGSAYAYLSMKEAIEESGLTEKEISNEKTGIIIGSGGPSIKNVMFAIDSTRSAGPKKIGPIYCTKNDGKYMFCNFSNSFKIKGV